jgi:hypothetical protein
VPRERRHERRALAACRDVARAKVGHHRHAGTLGHAGRGIELHGPALAGTMAQRLSVHAGGG